MILRSATAEASELPPLSKLACNQDSTGHHSRLQHQPKLENTLVNDSIDHTQLTVGLQASTRVHRYIAQPPCDWMDGKQHVDDADISAGTKATLYLLGQP